MRESFYSYSRNTDAGTNKIKFYGIFEINFYRGLLDGLLDRGLLLSLFTNVAIGGHLQCKTDRVIGTVFPNSLQPLQVHLNFSSGVTETVPITRPFLTLKVASDVLEQNVCEQ